jgi:hypothetical protein
MNTTIDINRQVNAQALQALLALALKGVSQLPIHFIQS